MVWVIHVSHNLKTTHGLQHQAIVWNRKSKKSAMNRWNGDIFFKVVVRVSIRFLLVAHCIYPYYLLCFKHLNSRTTRKSLRKFKSMIFKWESLLVIALIYLLLRKDVKDRLRLCFELIIQRPIL